MSDVDPSQSKLFTFQSGIVANVNMRWADLSPEIKKMSAMAVKLSQIYSVESYLQEMGIRRNNKTWHLAGHPRKPVSNLFYFSHHCEHNLTVP